MALNRLFSRVLLSLVLVSGLLAGHVHSEQTDEQRTIMDKTELLRQAWETYHATSAEMREWTESMPRFQENPAHRAKAYHSLLEAQAMAYSLAVATRSEHPVIHTRLWFSEFYTLGGTSPDFYYGGLFLDGSKNYKITGHFGDYKLIVAQAFSHLMGHPDIKMLGNFEFDKFELGEDGSFEIIVSAEEHEGNWIPLDPDSRHNFFFIRRAVADWNDELGDMKVTLLSEPSVYDEQDMELQAERILLASHFMRFLVKQWNTGIYDTYLSYNDGKKNSAVVVPGSAIAVSTMGSPSTNYVWGVYDLQEDEALIVELEVPDAKYWGFQLFDVWCKPLDFVNRQTDVNMSRVAVDSDGKYRVVISAEDPGVANWLDPAGRLEGTMVGRNYLSETVPAQPVVKLVKAAEVLKHLPADTKLVTPEQRQEALEYRRTSYLKMFNEIK